MTRGFLFDVEVGGLQEVYNLLEDATLDERLNLVLIASSDVRDCPTRFLSNTFFCMR